MGKRSALFTWHPQALRAGAAVAIVVCLFGLLSLHEYERYLGVYAVCQADYNLHVDFTRSHVCRTDENRLEYEKRGLTRCYDANRYILIEHPRTCAFRAWLDKSLVGSAHAGILELWGTFTGTVWLYLIVPCLLLCIYYISVSQKAGTERHALTLESAANASTLMADIMGKMYNKSGGGDGPLSLAASDVCSNSSNTSNNISGLSMKGNGKLNLDPYEEEEEEEEERQPTNNITTSSDTHADYYITPRRL